MLIFYFWRNISGPFDVIDGWQGRENVKFLQMISGIEIVGWCHIVIIQNGKGDFRADPRPDESGAGVDSISDGSHGLVPFFLCKSRKFIAWEIRNWHITAPALVCINIH